MVRGLIVSQFPPLPANQGNRMRLLAACEEFKRRDCKLDFLYYPREDGGMFSERDLSSLADYFELVFTVPSEHAWPSFSNRYQKSTEIYHDSVGEYYRFLSGRVSYDFVYVNYAPFAHVFRLCRPEVVCILDTHDKLTERRDVLEEQGLLPNFFSIEQSDEGGLAGASDLVIAIKPSESDFYREISPKPVLSIGVPVTEEAAGAERAGRGKTITYGFIGSSNAVNSFALTNLFELVRSRPALFENGARFLIVGKVVTDIEVPEEIRDYVSCVRFVDALSDFYDQCDVVIVPTIKSTGLKIKSIEALSYKKAILSTEDGFDGIASPVAYHNCPSQLDMIAYIEKMLAGELTVDEMVGRSLEVATAYQSSYSFNIEKLVKCCAKYDVALFLTDGVNIDELYAYLFSMLRFLKIRCRIDVYAERPDLVSAHFLEAAGVAETRVFGPGDALQAGRYNLMIHGGPPEPFSHIAALSDVVMNFSDASVAISLAQAPEKNRLFRPVKPLDFIDRSYWGHSRRLVFLLPDTNVEARLDDVLDLIRGPGFSTIRAQYRQIQIVARDRDLRGHAGIAEVGAVGMRFRDFLFVDPGEVHSHVVILAPTARQAHSALSSVVSMPNSTFFTDCETARALVTFVCGPDLQVQPFSGVATLGMQLELVLRRQHQNSGSWVRHRPNVGAMPEVIRYLKASIIDCIVAGGAGVDA